MKKNFNCMAVVVTLASVACSSPKSDSVQYLQDEIYYADPSITVVDGVYYLAGTQYTEKPGFSVLKSTDLQNWTEASDVEFSITPGDSIFGTKGFWAPQMISTDSCVYMFYTANEQVAMAKSDAIAGSYAWNGCAIDTTEKNIDPFLFTDVDGRNYLYHVRFDHGNFLWVGEFDINSGKIIDGTLHPVFKNDQPWEHTLAYESAPIMEGPTVVRIGDLYYLFYSANHFMSPDYAVGYATATSPLGPWKKSEHNPIIHRNIVGEKGSGHGDLFIDNDGNMRYVYHVHNCDTLANPRRTRIISLKLDTVTNPVSPLITVDPATIIHPTFTTSSK